MKHIMLTHYRKNNAGVRTSFFETEPEALAEYQKVHETYPEERVKVVDLMSEQTLADSRPDKKRRRR